MKELKRYPDSIFAKPTWMKVHSLLTALPQLFIVRVPRQWTRSLLNDLNSPWDHLVILRGINVKCSIDILLLLDEDVKLQPGDKWLLLLEVRFSPFRKGWLAKFVEGIKCQMLNVTFSFHSNITLKKKQKIKCYWYMQNMWRLSLSLFERLLAVVRPYAATRGRLVKCLNNQRSAKRIIIFIDID